MDNHDEMFILCTEMVLGMSHKLNGTPKINIAINGLDSIFNLVILTNYPKWSSTRI